MSEEWPERAVCRFDELADPGAREFRIGAGYWPFRGLVVRRGEAVYAWANVCPHQHLPLNLGDDDFLMRLGQGVLLRCAMHGALFVPETGICVAGPCAGHGLQPLACRVQAGMVLVRAPDQQA